MKELLPAILCIIILGYIIYLEFKDHKPKRDLFVDMSIAIIIMIVGLYSMYEYHFDFHIQVVWWYVVLLVMGAFYVFLVFYHEKHPKEVVNKKEEASQEDVPLEELPKEDNTPSGGDASGD